MKKNILISAIFLLLIASAFKVIEIVNWKVKDDTYTVTFKGGHISGAIKGLKATVLFDEANPAKSKITASIDANSVKTGNGMRDKHARSESALAADKFPSITFVSDAVSKKGTGYEASGKLTMKGVTKQVLLPFTIEHKGDEAILNGTLKISPKDFNVERGGTPDFLDITIKVPVTK